jgi:hypothetical protein
MRSRTRSGRTEMALEQIGAGKGGFAGGAGVTYNRG